MSKQERKERLRKWQAAERTELVDAMLLTPEQLVRLLNHLDEKLTSCDHTTMVTARFLAVEELEQGPVLAWLASHGGYCDCEVAFNLEDLASSFDEQPVPSRPKPRKKGPPRSLNTSAGWDLTALPKPWRVANLHALDEPLRLQLGKKAGCTVAVVESAMPPGDRASLDYWSRLWYSRTDLPEKSTLQVAHEILAIPGHLHSTLVSTPSWTPAYCWIVPDAQTWHLEMRSELSRLQGDLPQVSRLISELAKKKDG